MDFKKRISKVFSRTRTIFPFRAITRLSGRSPFGPLCAVIEAPETFLTKSDFEKDATGGWASCTDDRSLCVSVSSMPRKRSGTRRLPWTGSGGPFGNGQTYKKPTFFLRENGNTDSSGRFTNRFPTLKEYSPLIPMVLLPLSQQFAPTLKSFVLRSSPSDRLF